MPESIEKKEPVKESKERNLQLEASLETLIGSLSKVMENASKLELANVDNKIKYTDANTEEDYEIALTYLAPFENMMEIEKVGTNDVLKVVLYGENSSDFDFRLFLNDGLLAEANMGGAGLNSFDDDDNVLFEKTQKAIDLLTMAVAVDKKVKVIEAKKHRKATPEEIAQAIGEVEALQTFF